MGPLPRSTAPLFCEVAVAAGADCAPRPALVMRRAERVVCTRCGVEPDWTCRCFGASTVTGGRLEDCAQASVTRSTDSNALTVTRQTTPTTFFFDTPTQDTPTTRPTSSACSLGLLYSTETIATSACALELIEGLNFRID